MRRIWWAVTSVAEGFFMLLCLIPILILYRNEIDYERMDDR